jgi:hypothetical protein
LLRLANTPRGAHRVVARRGRMIVIGRHQAADRGRGQAEDPSARKPATSFPPKGHRGPRSGARNMPCFRRRPKTRAPLSPAPKN